MSVCLLKSRGMSRHHGPRPESICRCKVEADQGDCPRVAGGDGGRTIIVQTAVGNDETVGVDTNYLQRERVSRYRVVEARGVRSSCSRRVVFAEDAKKKLEALRLLILSLLPTAMGVRWRDTGHGTTSHNRGAPWVMADGHRHSFFSHPVHNGQPSNSTQQRHNAGDAGSIFLSWQIWGISRAKWESTP